MSRSCFSVIVGVGLTILAGLASAQSPLTKPKAPLENASGSTKSAVKAEAVRINREHRAQARSLLISLASDARSFRDQVLRARSLARIADALWDVDAEQGRVLFRHAWAAAQTADRENEEPLNVRKEILKLTATRDHPLAEEFLQKLKADQQETKADSSNANLWTLPDALQQRLSLAEEMLRMDDFESALQFADPVLGSVTISTLNFLTQLRERDPVGADRRYAAMLANTGVNMLADANTISLLSSYIFTPRLYVTFNRDGGAESSWTPSAALPSSVSPDLRLAFFYTASGVLLRPLPAPEQDQTTAGIAGKYMAVKRLLPLFEQYAPKELTEAIRGQFGALNSLVSDSVREGEDEWTQKGLSPEKSLTDQEQPLLDKIDRAKTTDERDQLYFRLALLALSKEDPKARDYVGKIDESEFRQQAQTWVDWGLAVRAIKKAKVDTALDLARTGELTHIQRVWLLTQSAKLLAKTDHDKALSLVDDATSEVRRIEGVDLNRPRGLLAIANALRLIEPLRVWDAVFDAVKAANSTDGFTGEEGVLTLTVKSKSRVLAKKFDAVPDFEIKGIFGEVATNDYERAVQLARGFQGEAPRANATIAISRALLNEKSPSVRQRPARKS